MGLDNKSVQLDIEGRHNCVRETCENYVAVDA